MHGLSQAVHRAPATLQLQSRTSSSLRFCANSDPMNRKPLQCSQLLVGEPNSVRPAAAVGDTAVGGSGNLNHSPLRRKPRCDAASKMHGGDAPPGAAQPPSAPPACMCMQPALARLRCCSMRKGDASVSGASLGVAGAAWKVSLMCWPGNACRWRQIPTWCEHSRGKRQSGD